MNALFRYKSKLFLWRRSTMPQQAPVPCRHPGCHALVSDGTGYCVDHQDDRRHRFHDATARYRQAARGPMATNSPAWRKIRARILSIEPLCRECQRQGNITPATCVDHIDEDPLNIADDNLQPLCASCHSRKTARVQRERRRDPFAARPARRTSILPDDYTF